MTYNKNQPSLTRLKVISSERRRPLVFWVGAGLSRDAGLPTWQALRDQLADEALEALVSLDTEVANELEAELTEARSTGSLWDAFTTIKSILGEASYKAAIRSRFEKASDVDIPEVYKAIWALDSVVGVLNLNIDGLATRAHRRIRPDEDAIPFVGRDAQHYAHSIAQRKPFVASLHGIHEDYSSWVFTRPDIKKLLGNPAYVSALNFIFADMCVVFAGISADDVAAGGILEQLTAQGIDVGSHFWITDRRDAKTHAWANAAGLEPIRYEPNENHDHTTVLLEILEDIKSYKSFDEKAPVVVPPGEERNALPSVQELRRLDDDDLRTQLSGYAKNLIATGGNTTDSEKYKAFLEEYSPSIHQAWHVTDKKPFNKFFRYEVTGKISNGPFSSVWRVKDGSGALAALKIIQTENLQHGPQLESFRRGVQSLRFMTNAKVNGVAKLIEAHEIPTAVIMEFIEGDDLGAIASNSSYKFWDQGIQIIEDLCAKLNIAHNLPEGVLHRDIRPSNVMVPFYFWGVNAQDSGHSPYEVVILNYDMSWHKDAQGRTISGNIQEAGYYAPEQLDNKDGELARSATVDSYGVGMTLFFAATKNNPPIGGSKAGQWVEMLDEIRPDRAAKWSSAVARLRRLIFAATQITAVKRPSVAEIGFQLRTLRQAINGEWSGLTPDAWAEEIFCRAIDGEYSVSPNGSEFTKVIRAGRDITVKGNLSKNNISVTFRNQAIDGTNWTNIDKRWTTKLQTAREILISRGWEIGEETRYSASEILLVARIPINTVKENFDNVIDGLTRGLNTVRLE